MNARHRPFVRTTLLGCVLAFVHGELSAADWPMFGRDATRNAVSPEADAPTEWDIESGRNIRWSAPLGSMTFGDPVVSGGLVWVGTNSYRIGNAADTPDSSVLACFRERDGKPLYRYVSPRLPQGRMHDWPLSSMACSPLIEGERMWFTTNRAEIVCLDIGSLLRSLDKDDRTPDDEPRVVWKRDLIGEFGVFPRGSIMNVAHFCSPAGYKDWIYVITGNGVDVGQVNIPAPEAPSVVCFEKATGKVVWTDKSPGSNLLLGQWASPLVIEVNGTPQVIVPQGDGWVRAFHAETGKLIWKFDINRKESKWTFGGRGTRNDILATPVCCEGRIYIASGQHPEHGEGEGRLVCLDPTKSGDISSELAVDADGQPLPPRRLQAVDAARGERAIPNPNSGLVWEFAKLGDEFEDQFHRSVSNVAIHDGLVIAADFSGLVHCFDARTGRRHWFYDAFAAAYGQPLIVNNKVYVPDEDGEVAVFRLSADPQVALNNGAPLAEIQLDGPVYCSPIFANRTLYVASQRQLYAISSGAGQDVSAKGPGGHWPQWRGPNRDNKSAETGLLQEWPEGGPPLVRRVDGLGEGICPVSIAGGRIYTISRNDDQEYVIALDEATGDHVWTRYLGRTIQQNLLMQWLTQRSPTVDDDRVYAVSALGDLACLRTADGLSLWRRNYEEHLYGKRGPWGFGDRPLVDGEKLIVIPGGEVGSITALDKRTGRQLWRCPVHGEKWGIYTTGMVAQIGDVRQFVTSFGGTLVGVGIEDGGLLWKTEVDSARYHSPFTPLVRDRHVLFPLGYGRKIAQLEIVPDDDGFEARTVYEERAVLDPFLDSTVLLGDHLYLFSQVASCHEWKTGKALWQKRYGPRAAAATYADGRVYLRDSDGNVVLIEATPEDMKETGQFTIPEPQRQAKATFPVIAGGRLYLRDNDRLFCYDVRADAPEAPAEPQTIVLDRLDTRAVAVERRRPRTGVDRAPDAVFVPTPQDVVEKMLELAVVTKDEVVCDLGSGDGRIVITAARKYGAKAVGYEIDAELVKLSRESVEQHKLGELVTIEHKDFFAVDLSECDVIAVYLQPQILQRLLPQFKKLMPGARIVSHFFAIPGVKPDSTIEFESADDGDRHTLHLWTAPLKDVGRE